MSILAALTSVDTSPLDAHGTVDAHMQDVFFWVFWASVVVGVFVAGLIVYSLIRFRRKSDDEEPEQFHGNTRLEITWSVIPFAILMALFVLSAINMSYVVSAPANTQHTVSVIGRQFDWDFFYEGAKAQDGRPIESVRVLYVPANTPIQLELTSTEAATPKSDPNPLNLVLSPHDEGQKCPPAVQPAGNNEYTGKPLVATGNQTFAEAAAALGCGLNHSFYVPTLAGQMNAIPGQVNQMWLDAQPGHYYGQCTELCGTGHAGMLVEVMALPLPDYNCLMAYAKPNPVQPYDVISESTVLTCKIKVPQ